MSASTWDQSFIYNNTLEKIFENLVRTTGPGLVIFQIYVNWDDLQCTWERGRLSFVGTALLKKATFGYIGLHLSIGWSVDVLKEAFA